MKKIIEYHWIEEIADKNGNIESVERIKEPYIPNAKNTDICIKQDVWDGAGSDFGYAYIDHEKFTLPTHFDNGRKVPMRFHKEVEAM